LVEIALACALADLGRNEEAVQVYDALLAKGSADADWPAIAHANRGNAHGALGHVDAAIADYEEAIRREPQRVTHHQNHARLFSQRKRWAEAHAVIVRGLGVVTGEGRIPLLLEKARTANEQEHAEVALAAADAVLAEVPDHPRALYQRAWALGMAGRLDDAQVSLRRLLELEPKNADARSALAKIEAALGATATVRGKKPWWKLWS
jgi:tetratricopeptide (TPR) repeat protein